MERVPAFDGLRALAAVLVVGFHTRLPGLSGGFVGVDIFFVLSGYLITSLLVAEHARDGRIAILSYIARRVRRLVPALVMMLAAVAAIFPLLYPDENMVAEVLLSGLYLSNISQVLVSMPSITGHTWSLSTEMQFYLLWPFLILAIHRVLPRHLFAVLIALFVLATLWRWLQYWEAGWHRAYYAPDTRLSGLILGGAFAALRRGPADSTGLFATAAGTVLLVAILSLSFGDGSAILWGTTAIEVSIAVLILSLRRGGGIIGVVLAARPLAIMGAWSYGIYLWHFPIALVARLAFDPWQAFTLTLCASTLLAAISYTFVERPIRQLRLQALLRPAA